MAFVGDLDRVAEIVLKVVQPDAERDLKLVHQDQERDAEAAVTALPYGHGGQQGRAHRDRRSRLEEGVRDVHHPPHQRQRGNQGDRDHEHGGRDRQIPRQRVSLIVLRPVPHDA